MKLSSGTALRARVFAPLLLLALEGALLGGLRLSAAPAMGSHSLPISARSPEVNRNAGALAIHTNANFRVSDNQVAFRIAIPNVRICNPAVCD